MQNGKHIVCILPAYNCAQTLERTISEVPKGLVDCFIMGDDASRDSTLEIAQKLTTHYPLQLISHKFNLGYGANQKACYKAALATKAEIVVMLHPDYQYESRLVGALAALVSSGVYDVALGSRILGKGALIGGMPMYKWVANRFLTAFENCLLNEKLSEYHTGFRAYSRSVLETLAFEKYSNDFLFDNEMLVHCLLEGFKIGEISVPTRYFPEASSIHGIALYRYGLGVVVCSLLGGIRKFLRPKKPKLQL